MGMGKQTARAVDRELMARDVFSSLFADFTYRNEIPEEPGKGKMNRSRCVPPDQRRGNFQEISLGYNGEQALQEASRCLRCDVRNNARSPWR
jgi:NADH-quinone oxidoreductase subunit F